MKSSTALAFGHGYGIGNALTAHERMKMELEEVMLAKVAAENAIHDVLTKFMEETRLNVSEVSLQTMETVSSVTGSHRWYVITGVSLDVRLR